MEKHSNSSRPVRMTTHLRKGRHSVAGARYFLTAVTKNRVVGLSKPAARDGIHDQWRALHRSEDFVFHCGTVMPDHVHLLFTLGARLELSRLMAKFKSLTRRVLNDAALQWQANYFDHRIRPDVLMESFARYIYLNPYRKGLISVDEEWKAWLLNRNYRPEFIEHLRDGKYPQPAWLADTVSLADLIQASVDTEEV